MKNIFNLSIKKGIFPDEPKIPKLSTWFKKDDNALMDNYRPISILSYLSKVLEKIIYDNNLYVVLSHKRNFKTFWK